MSTVACPHCAGAMLVNAGNVGQQVACPYCNGLVQLPNIPMAIAPDPTPRTSISRNYRRKKQGPPLGMIAGIAALCIVALLGSWWAVGEITGTGMSFGEPRLDWSTEESKKRSMERVTANMTEAEKKEFADALIGIVVVGAFSDPNFLSGRSLDEVKNANELMAKEKLHGKTASQILAEAARIKEAIRKKQEAKKP